MEQVNENDLKPGNVYGFLGIETEKAKFIGIYAGCCCFKPISGVDNYIQKQLRLDGKNIQVIKFGYAKGLASYFKH